MTGRLTVLDEYPGDELKSAALDRTRWSIVRELASNWSATESGVRIQATAGYLDGTANSNQNVFLQTPEFNDYFFSVKLNGRPTTQYWSAGPIVYLNDDNFVKMA
ncbi:MAG: hypothetical protein FWG11_04100, partial [Promicromonosporaceae bacterium]|nr:hypothetical protein [Promicromonosporaceae bacterium]